MKMRKVFVLPFLFLFLMGCNGNVQPPSTPNQTTNTKPIASPVYELVDAYPNLSFKQPLEFQFSANKVYVVEKSGIIYVFDNNAQAAKADVFLDLRSRVDSNASEKGLLGLAFHPNFAQNGLFYVNYTNRSNTIVACYQVNSDHPEQGLLDSEQILVSIPQPYSNHNGGHLSFGLDGYLYIGTGDGGSAGDPQGNAQNLNSLLGKILRIDVDKTSPGRLYSIPQDNPLKGNNLSYREEIYAYGLRNPWKFSFDFKTGKLWAADVGQNKMEEIDIIESGKNYGWNKMEGSLSYPENSQHSKEGLELPVWEYNHSLGKAITGGYVYYGTETPSLIGAYIYGDYVSGMIWALRIDEAQTQRNELLLDTKLNISSFGLDQNNALYIIDLGGKIYKLIEK